MKFYRMVSNYTKCSPSISSHSSDWKDVWSPKKLFKKQFSGELRHKAVAHKGPCGENLTNGIIADFDSALHAELNGAIGLSQ